MLRWRLCKVCVAFCFLWVVGVRPIAAQVFSTPGSGGNRFGTATAMDGIGAARMDGNLFLINSQGPGATSP